MKTARPCLILASILTAFLALRPRDIQADDNAPAPTAVIRVDAGKVEGRVSRYLTGACIEDVNHEIYGGIYSQMIFGERFQEPPAGPPVKGFAAFEGSWTLAGEVLDAGGGPGPKLISDHAPIAKGEVGVEVFFADRAGGKAGLIVKVAKPGRAADNFTGYEVSLDPALGVLTLGRHRNNWEPIKDTPCKVPVNQWIPLVARMTERTLEVLVNGKTVIRYEDSDHPLETGAIGLRQWQRPARYRKLWVKTGEKTEAIALEATSDDAGAISGMWGPVRRGNAIGKYKLGPQSIFGNQRIRFISGEGEIGIENQGLNRWGMSLVAGQPYEGFVWLNGDEPAELVASLESRDGSKVYAQTTLSDSRGAGKLNFTLTPSDTDKTGRFVLKLTKPGSVVLGFAHLQPGDWGRFKGLPVRRDVVEGLIDQGITVLRYGGSMVNAEEYRWKRMLVKNVVCRGPYRGTWYPYSSNGWGIIDFLDLCEAAGFLGVPDFNVNETPEDMADFVAFANGPADSGLGETRALHGHPEPYRLAHLELGNEERVDDNYFERFRAIAEKVWAADPDIILVVGDFVYSNAIADPDRFTGAASGITNMAAHKKILELAKQHNREVWFDIHIGTEHPGALGELDVVPTYVHALEKIADGAKFKVVVFELNSGNHAQRRALANAIAIGALEQLGDRLPIVCAANCLQPDGQNDNGWDQGLLFLNPSQVWLQPPGYVTRMISRSYQPLRVKTEVETTVARLQVNADRSEDGKSLTLRVVNPGDKPVAAQLHFAGFTPTNPVAKVEELAGPTDAVNTADQPERIKPKQTEWRHEMKEGAAKYTFPPNSFTVLTLE